MAFKISEKSTDNLIEDGFYVTSHFSLAAFKIFLAFGFQQFDYKVSQCGLWVPLGLTYLTFVEFLEFVVMSFIKFGKFSAIISSNHMGHFSLFLLGLP